MRRLATPEPAPPQIELWKLDFDFTLPIAAQDWDCLNEAERAHAGRYRQHPDRVRYSVMRAALRRLLASRLGCRAEAVQIVSNAFGKPRLAAPGGLAFNQSHAGQIGLLALAKGLEVGVDLEPDQLAIAAEDLDGMAAQMLSARERQSTGRLDQQAFLRRWVGKEAALKALGVGIAEHLHTLEIAPHDDGRYTVSHGQPGWPPVHARQLDIHPGYAAALAWTQP